MGGLVRGTVDARRGVQCGTRGHQRNPLRPRDHDLHRRSHDDDRCRDDHDGGTDDDIVDDDNIDDNVDDIHDIDHRGADDHH